MINDFTAMASVLPVLHDAHQLMLGAQLATTLVMLLVAALICPLAAVGGVLALAVEGLLDLYAFAALAPSGTSVHALAAADRVLCLGRRTTGAHW